MKILLINNNPVVSRLTALSARKEEIEIDEIQEVTELSSDTYDIVFVDADSWTKDVRDVISENIKTQKSVLFYADADGNEEEKASFDLSILKPFLPSEVSAIIRSIEEKTEKLDETINEENHFNILDDTKKVDTRTELFDLDGLDEMEEKKEELALNLDDNLELDELSFDDKLEEAFPLKINTLDDEFDNEAKLDLDMKEEIVPKKVLENTEKEIDTDLFDLDLSDEVPSLDDDLFSENKKEKTLDMMNELELDDEVKEVISEKDEELALEIDEPLIEKVKKETQILDELEIENIKGILTEDNSDDMTLEDLMPAMPTMNVLSSIEEKEEGTKKVEEKVTNISNIDSNVLAQTLAAMPVENLRELLAGAKVNIKIKFPKFKK